MDYPLLRYRRFENNMNLKNITTYKLKISNKFSITESLNFNNFGGS
ncbi:hypothetical protein EU96_1027 [Prochlorococcus marinus str. MIT 9302]|uniref:Uncharacterized protein n=1 Tax=Prochlorococcus marinus str. MIT 9302 TaxID=74545 RepID=A0A0A2A6S0_PROMR|nr:hypothetical protein EU96_1027 [Prochlorococcus marinus str. MIT 9302]